MVLKTLAESTPGEEKSHKTQLLVNHTRRLSLPRVVIALYLLALALLPWSWFAPFHWLHENAQWSDAVFAAAVLAWLIERWRLANWPRFEPFHFALAFYFLFACLSLLFASPNPGSELPKLVGVGELCTLAVITSDLGSKPGVSLGIGRAIAVSALVMATAAAAGLVLFYFGIGSQLIGIYGELEPSPWYARVQAGTHNPNLLASFCIFAAAIVARRDSELPVWLRRVTLAALWITVLLTFSRGILGFALAAMIRNATTPLRRRIAVSAAVVFLLLIASATFWKPNLDPSHPFETHVEQVASTRFQAATSSLISLATHPLFGTGLGTHPGVALGVPFDAHLTPVNIASTLGLPALIAIAFLIASLWMRRSRPADLAIWGGLAGLALDGLAQDVEDFRHVWVMIGLADCASQTDRSNMETATDSSVRSLR